MTSEFRDLPPEVRAELLDSWAREMSAEFETNFEPDPDGEVPVRTALAVAAMRRADAEAEVREVVERARDAQLSWRVIGEALGTTGEAARQRYSKRDSLATNRGGDLRKGRTGRLVSKNAKTGRRLSKRAIEATSKLAGGAVVIVPEVGRGWRNRKEGASRVFVAPTQAEAESIARRLASEGVDTYNAVVVDRSDTRHRTD